MRHVPCACDLTQTTLSSHMKQTVHLHKTREGEGLTIRLPASLKYALQVPIRCMRVAANGVGHNPLRLNASSRVTFIPDFTSLGHGSRLSSCSGPAFGADAKQTKKKGIEKTKEIKKKGNEKKRNEKQNKETKKKGNCPSDQKQGHVKHG